MTAPASSEPTPAIGVRKSGSRPVIGTSSVAPYPQLGRCFGQDRKELTRSMPSPNLERVRRFAIALCVLAASACSADQRPPEPSASPSPAVETPASGTHRLALDYGGNKRTYVLHAPPGYEPSKRLPLVIALHYYPGTGNDLRELIGFDAKADQNNFLVAYPDGHGMGFNALVCCGKQDDVGFLKALTEHLIQTWRADPDRVYLTGISNGGDMSFRMAVEATGMFAAIGVVSGGFGGELAAKPDYVPRKPVSVLTVIGGNDGYVGTFREGIRLWQERISCTSTGSETKPAYTRTTSKCADGSDVEVYVVPEMGHVWPGGAAGRMSAPDAGLSATDVIWTFFATHPRLR